ncbi:MAG: hypothetical protein WA821_15175 [Anaerolineales bacterium]
MNNILIKNRISGAPRFVLELFGNTTISATQLIWEFFVAHPKP